MRIRKIPYNSSLVIIKHVFKLVYLLLKMSVLAAKCEKHRSENIELSLFVATHAKTRVFYTYNHHGNEPLLAAILASGKYGHVYLQLYVPFT